MHRIQGSIASHLFTNSKDKDIALPASLCAQDLWSDLFRTWYNWKALAIYRWNVHYATNILLGRNEMSSILHFCRLNVRSQQGQGVSVDFAKVHTFWTAYFFEEFPLNCDFTVANCFPFLSCFFFAKKLLRVCKNIQEYAKYKRAISLNSVWADCSFTSKINQQFSKRSYVFLKRILKSQMKAEFWSLW